MVCGLLELFGPVGIKKHQIVVNRELLKPYQKSTWTLYNLYVHNIMASIYDITTFTEFIKAGRDFSGFWRISKVAMLMI